ncbi:MAG: hypothetical protein EBZ69_01265 [Alphaproteobacteria bacterium]|jgi:hypothetical protein|nr:hypothetical protein [Alphaproteobacteria bacterium]
MLSVISIRKLDTILDNIDDKYKQIIRNITRMQLKDEINNNIINTINCKDIDDKLILEMNSIINKQKIDKNNIATPILFTILENLYHLEEKLNNTIITNNLILSNLETFDVNVRNNILYEIINITIYESKSLNDNLSEIQIIIDIISKIISLDID